MRTMLGKRLISLILSLAMVIGLVPAVSVVAYAGSTTSLEVVFFDQNRDKETDGELMKDEDGAVYFDISGFPPGFFNHETSSIEVGIQEIWLVTAGSVNEAAGTDDGKYQLYSGGTISTPGTLHYGGEMNDFEFEGAGYIEKIRIPNAEPGTYRLKHVTTAGTFYSEDSDYSFKTVKIVNYGETTKKPVFITAGDLPDAAAGEAYSFQMQAQSQYGGALTWSATNLPAGLTMSSSGLISGTAPDVTGISTYYVNVTVQEAGGSRAQKAFYLMIRTMARTVNFYLNGGSPAAGETLRDYRSQSKLKGETVVLPAAPVLAGMDFLGWKCGSGYYDPGDVYTVGSSDADFVADWLEKEPVTVTMAEPISGYLNLYGTYENGQSTWIQTVPLDGPTILTGDDAITISAADLDRLTAYNGEMTGLELRGSLNGNSYGLLASASAAVTNGASIALTKEPYEEISGKFNVTGNGHKLTEGEDYTLHSLRYDPEGGTSYTGYARYFPIAVSSGANYKVRLDGIPGSPYYSDFDWTTDYDAVLNTADGSLSVDLPLLAGDVSVSGSVTLAEQPLSGVTVTASLYHAGMSRTISAVTDEDGRYQFDLFAGTYVTLSVRKDGRSLYIDNYYTVDLGETAPGSSVTADLTVSYAVLDYGVTFEATAAEGQETLLKRYLSNVDADTRFTVANGETTVSTDRIYLGSPSFSGTKDLRVAPNAALDLRLSSSVLPADIVSSVVLDGGTASADLRSPVKAGVLVKMRSQLTSGYYFVWYDADGNYIGSSYTSLYNEMGDKAFLCPSDSASGPFHAVLIHNAYRSSLRSYNTGTGQWEYLPYNQVKTMGSVARAWDFTLTENEITELESVDLDAFDTKNNQYITKPGSTMTPSVESWSSTDELIRISGTIGLDEGLTNGRLLRFYGDPTLPEDYGDTQTTRIQYITINGVRYQPSVILHQDTWNLDLSDLGDKAPTLPCNYTIYAYPGSEGMDMYMDLYVDVVYTDENSVQNNKAYAQYVGETRIKSGASLYTASTYVNQPVITVKGKAEANKTITIYDDGVEIGTARTDGNGSWSAKVTLNGTDSRYGTVHFLSAVSETGADSGETMVIHQTGGVQLDSFTMSWANSKNGWVHTIPVGGKCQFTGSLYDVTFKAVIENPEMLLDNYTGFDDEKVVFKVATSDGYVRYLYPEQNGNTFTATIDTTLRCPVTLAEVIFGGKIVTSFEYPTDDDLTSPTVYDVSDADRDELTELLDGMLAELTDSFDANDPQRITSVQQVLDVVGLYTEEHNFSVTYDAEGNPTYHGTDHTDPEDADMQTANMKLFASNMADMGVTIREYAVRYDSNENLIQWMNRAGKEFYDSDPSQKGIFTATRLYASEEDFLTEKAAIAQYAEARTQERWGSVQKVDEYYMGDLCLDSAGDPASGTYCLGVKFMDTLAGGVHLYSAEAILVLTEDFCGYGETEMSGSSLHSMPLLGSTASFPVLLGDSGSPYGPSHFNGNYEASDLYNFTSGSETGSNRWSWLTGGVGNTGDSLSESWHKVKKSGYARNLEKITGGVGKFFGKVSTYLGGAAIGFSVFNFWLRAERDRKMLEDIDAITDSPCFQKLPKSEQLKGLKMRKELMDIMDIRNWLDFDSLIVSPLTMSAGWIANVFANGAVAAFSASMQENAIASLIASGALPNAGAAGTVGAGTATATGATASAAFGWSLLAITVAATLAAGHKLEEKEAETISTYNANYNAIKGLIHKHASMPGSYDPDCQDPERKDQKNSMNNSNANGGANNNEHDPSGIVYEAVIQNPVEGATVTLYYATDSEGTVYKKTESELVDQLKPAQDLAGMDPQDPVQITGEDGRYQWFVPEGLWYVTAEYGTLSGDSERDKEAVVSKSLPMVGDHYVSNLLPVLPVQTEVNIPLIDTAVPYVEDVSFEEGRGIVVTFSKYMVDTGTTTASVLDLRNYVLTDSGTGDTIVIDHIVSAEQGNTPENIGGQDVTTYSRKVLLVPEDLAVLDPARPVDLTIKGNMRSYAGTYMDGDYVMGSFVPDPDADSGLSLVFKGLAFSAQNCSLTAMLRNRSGEDVDAAVCTAVYYNGRLIMTQLDTDTFADDTSTDIPLTMDWDYTVSDLNKLAIAIFCFDSVTGVPLCRQAKVR